MQFNIYIPKEKRRVVEKLGEMSRQTGRAKNELALEALEAYVDKGKPELGRHSMGAIKPWRRGELYEKRLRVPRGSD